MPTFMELLEAKLRGEDLEELFGIRKAYHVRRASKNYGKAVTQANKAAARQRIGRTGAAERSKRKLSKYVAKTKHHASKAAYHHNRREAGRVLGRPRAPW
jgi:hypothetical protein